MELVLLYGSESWYMEPVLLYVSESWYMEPVLLVYTTIRKIHTVLFSHLMIIAALKVSGTTVKISV